jgi:ADP-ribose pyrophosphatase
LRLELASRTFRVRGREVTHRFLHLGEVVCVLAREADGRVLMVRQYRAALDRRILELPAGWCEPGEPPEAAAVRELEEETGYRPRRVERLLSAWPAPGYSSEVLHLFAAHDLERTAPRPDDTEEIELVRLTDEECLRAVQQGAVRDGKSLLALMAVRLGWRSEPALP